MKLGPRSCALCPPGRRQSCVVCGGKDRHCHVDVYTRAGVPLGSAPVCADHAPPVSDPPIGTQAPAQPSPADARTSLAKRTRDRAYRLATSIVRERHYDEFAAEYAKALGREHDNEVAA